MFCLTWSIETKVTGETGFCNNMNIFLLEDLAPGPLQILLVLFSGMKLVDFSCPLSESVGSVSCVAPVPLCSHSPSAAWKRLNKKCRSLSLTLCRVTLDP